MNILGWEHWKVENGHQKGPDYKLKAEYQLRPTVCPKCGVESPKLESRGWSSAHVRDTPIHGKRVGIDVTKRKWKCGECGRTFVDQPPELDDKRRMTVRLLTVLRTKVFDRPFVDLANEYGVSEATIRNIFTEEAERREARREVAPPIVLGIDEVHIGGRRFVVANLDGDRAALVDLLQDRTQPTVEAFLGWKGWASTVQVVAMDMWRPYWNAVRKTLPNATIVVDKFHLLMLANRAVDRIRDGVVRYGSYKDRQLLKGSRKILRRRESTLDEGQLQTMNGWRRTFPELVEAFDAKERLHDIYEAADRVEGGERIRAWTASLPTTIDGDFRDVQTALAGWEEEILNYFETRVTNAGTERLNRFIRLTNELGNGYRFEALRAKMIYGTPTVSVGYWQAPVAATPIPGSSMSFSLGRSGTGSGPAGADLDWLISQMEKRQGPWSEAGLWKRERPVQKS